MADKKLSKKKSKGATRKERLASWIPVTLRWVKRLSLSGLAVAGIALGFYVEQVVEHSFDWPVSKVLVKGEYHHVKKEELIEMIKPFTGTSFVAVDLQKIKAKLEEEPTIYRAMVERRWPDTLIVSIVEQIPYAKWGDNALLNTDGDLFERTETFAETAGVLPRLSGPEDTNKQVIEVYKQLLKKLEKSTITITELFRDDKGAYRAILDSGIELNIGQNEIDKRMDRFLTVYEQQLKTQLDTVAAVDLRYSNGVAVKWNQEKVITNQLSNYQDKNNQHNNNQIQNRQSQPSKPKLHTTLAER